MITSNYMLCPSPPVDLESLFSHWVNDQPYSPVQQKLPSPSVKLRLSFLFDGIRLAKDINMQLYDSQLSILPDPTFYKFDNFKQIYSGNPLQIRVSRTNIASYSIFFCNPFSDLTVFERSQRRWGILFS